MAEIAVLIPHYNALEAVKKSIRSIEETIDVDVFIIDDGSETKPKVEDFNFYLNGRIEVYYLDENKGIEHALNFGLSIIKSRKYKYIARLDCADTCKKNRFHKQVEFLKKNKEIEFIGSWVNLFDDNNNFLYTLKMPADHHSIKKRNYLNAMFIHPSICFKAKLLDIIGNYPTTHKAAEDYAFFFKVIRATITANIPEALVNIEINSKGISSTKRKKQVLSRIKIILDNFYFGVYPVYGLFRNIVLLFISQKISIYLKKVLYSK